MLLWEEIVGKRCRRCWFSRGAGLTNAKEGYKFKVFLTSDSIIVRVQLVIFSATKVAEDGAWWVHAR